MKGQLTRVSSSRDISKNLPCAIYQTVQIVQTTANNFGQKAANNQWPVFKIKYKL